MAKRMYAVDKIRRCKRCLNLTKIFYKEPTGFYHCETCGSVLVEPEHDAAEFNDMEQEYARMGTGQL